MENEDKIGKAMDMLFKARWNIPKAACYLEITPDECKEMFNEFCKENPPTFSTVCVHEPPCSDNLQ